MRAADIGRQKRHRRYPRQSIRMLVCHVQPPLAVELLSACNVIDTGVKRWRSMVGKMPGGMLEGWETALLARHAGSWQDAAEG